MSSPLDFIQQKLSLLQEAEIALYSVETGLGQLAKNRPYAQKPYYFGWFLFLSTGFERLMKVIICLQEFETSGRLPTKKSLKDIGHGLVTLRNAVVTRCYTPTYLGRNFGQEDYDFLTSDTVLEHMLSALNDFAQGDRYMFMDRISNPVIGREWPKMRWKEVERFALSSSIEYQHLPADSPELAREANRLVQACIERFIRALARLFVYGNLGNAAGAQYVLIYDFMRLEDSQLGHKIYEP